VPNRFFKNKNRELMLILTLEGLYDSRVSYACKRNRGMVEEGTGWSGWSGAQLDGQCLSLLIFPCTIKSTSSLLAPAHPGGPGKRAVKNGCGELVMARDCVLVYLMMCSQMLMFVCYSDICIVTYTYYFITCAS